MLGRQRSRVYPETQRMEAYGDSVNPETTNAVQQQQSGPRMMVRRKGQAAQLMNGNGATTNDQPVTTSAAGDGPSTVSNSDNLVKGADELLERLRNL
jgi:hypothetical protein